MSESCFRIQCAPLPWFAFMPEAVSPESVYGWSLELAPVCSVSSSLQPVFVAVLPWNNLGGEQERIMNNITLLQINWIVMICLTDKCQSWAQFAFPFTTAYSCVRVGWDDSTPQTLAHHSYLHVSRFMPLSISGGEGGQIFFQWRSLCHFL